MASILISYRKLLKADSNKSDEIIFRGGGRGSSMGPPLLLPLLQQKKPRSRRKTQTILKSPLTRYVTCSSQIVNQCAECCFQASIDMMTASATTEEQQHSSSPSPHPPSPPRPPNLPSTPLLSGRRSPSPGEGPQSSLQENRRRPVVGSREIAVAAAASAETSSVNSNCAVTVNSSPSSCPATEISSNSSSVINTTSTSETTALVVRHSSCDSGAPQALL